MITSTLRAAQPLRSERNVHLEPGVPGIRTTGVRLPGSSLAVPLRVHATTRPSGRITCSSYTSANAGSSTAVVEQTLRPRFWGHLHPATNGIRSRQNPTRLEPRRRGPNRDGDLETVLEAQVPKQPPQPPIRIVRADEPRSGRCQRDTFSVRERIVHHTRVRAKVGCALAGRVGVLFPSEERRVFHEARALGWVAVMATRRRRHSRGHVTGPHVHPLTAWGANCGCG